MCILVLQAGNSKLTHITSLEELTTICSEMQCYESIVPFNNVDINNLLPPLTDNSFLWTNEGMYKFFHFCLSRLINDYQENCYLSYFQSPTILPCNNLSEDMRIKHELWVQQQLLQFTVQALKQQTVILPKLLNYKQQYDKLINALQNGYLSDDLAAYYDIKKPLLLVGKEGKEHSLVLQGLQTWLQEGGAYDINGLHNTLCKLGFTYTNSVKSRIFDKNSMISDYKVDSVLAEHGNKATLAKMSNNNLVNLLEYLHANQLSTPLQEEILQILHTRNT
jgi:hypothetical protein